VANIADLLIQLKGEGYEIASVEQAEGSTELQDFVPDVSKKLALIFGNEVDGVSDEAIALSDHCIEIPQFGTKHSFNVSVSMGIVLWEILRKLKY
jgi:tRNA G18 (ribose-2'-O)-methylase SpoU